MKRYLLTVLFLANILKGVTAQEYQKLTLEDIYKNSIFKTNTIQGVRWMNDGRFYTSFVRNNENNNLDIIKYSTI